jgi:hypothetical protein
MLAAQVMQAAAGIGTPALRRVFQGGGNKLGSNTVARSAVGVGRTLHNAHCTVASTGAPGGGRAGPRGGAPLTRCDDS